jgi:hypothetical protein
MYRHRGFIALVLATVASVLLFSHSAAGQGTRAPQSSPPSTPVSEKDVAELQEQLLKLVRLSPTLAEVVARDPSLLSNADYVNRNNPELEHFLQAHPEIERNPDFYLFNNLHGEHEPPSETLERKLWPQPQNNNDSDDFIRGPIIEGGLPLLAFLAFLVAFLWLTRLLLENRRWGRIFKLQSDVHGKLLERFGTSQEVLTYMSTDAGKKFLEAAPISVGLDRKQPVPSPVARVLTPLQIGIVMSLLGVGLIFLRHSFSHGAGLLLIGTVILMPGLGFIISAGITWVLARRLGLISESGAQQ